MSFHILSHKTQCRSVIKPCNKNAILSMSVKNDFVFYWGCVINRILYSCRFITKVIELVE